MRTDPEPLGVIAVDPGESTMLGTNSRRPESGLSFKVKRAVSWIAKPKLKILASETTDVARQLLKAATKASGRRGSHRVVWRPSPDALPLAVHTFCPARRTLRPLRSADP